MKIDKYLYVSFLDVNSIRGGGHIETESEIHQFKKLFNNLEVLFSDKSITTKTLRKYRQNGISKLFSKPTNKFLPIFGSRPSLKGINLSNYSNVIIADGRCLIPFIVSIFSFKKVFFKSHGSLAIYFCSFINASLILFKYRPINTFLKSIYFIILIFIFFLVELLIYILSEKIYMMRSKDSFNLNYWGKLYNYFFSYKTVYSFCPSIESSLLEKRFHYEGFKKIKKDLKFEILILGNWDLTNNLASLVDFISRINSKYEIVIYLVGQISCFNKKLINNLSENKPKVNINILGFRKDISALKKTADFSVSCSRFGSGIPIKAIEILKEAPLYKYKPLISNYCKNALNGILPISPLNIYPDNGPIVFEEFI